MEEDLNGNTIGEIHEFENDGTNREIQKTPERDGVKTDEKSGRDSANTTEEQENKEGDSNLENIDEMRKQPIG